MLNQIVQVFWRILLVGILTIFMFLGLVSVASPISTAAANSHLRPSGEILYQLQVKLDE